MAWPLARCSADNGAPTGPTFTAIGGCNAPLRGSKHTLWEGGVRSASFVSGSLVGHRAGQVEPGLMHAVDWLPTLTYVAARFNASHAASVLARGFALDGVNAWPMLAGAGVASNRTTVLHNYDPQASPGDKGCCGYAGLTQGEWKLLVDPGEPDGIYACNATLRVAPVDAGSDADVAAASAAWAAMQHGAAAVGGHAQGVPPLPPGAVRRVMPDGSNRTVYLFRPLEDPQETTNLAAAQPEVVTRLLGVLGGYIRAALPDGHGPSQRAADPALQPGKNKGFWTPWLPDP